MKKHLYSALVILALTPVLTMAEEPTKGTLIQLSGIGIFTLVTSFCVLGKESVNVPFRAILNIFKK